MESLPGKNGDFIRTIDKLSSAAQARIIFRALYEPRIPSATFVSIKLPATNQSFRLSIRHPVPGIISSRPERATNPGGDVFPEPDSTTVLRE